MGLEATCFNSRTPGGVRRDPQLGAASLWRFNSRTPGGVRPSLDQCCGRHPARFNSRTPGGVRQKDIGKYSIKLSFNSRTPGGVRRVSVDLSRLLIPVSIHAPREGCDHML